MNIFKQFAISLYSPKTMAMFRFQKIGKTIGYVFVMMLIAYIFTGTHLALKISNGVSDFKQVINQDVPEFTLSDGQLSSEIDDPIIKQDSLQTFIFDTTGEITRDDLDQYDETVAILQDRILLKSAGKVDSVEYSMFQNASFTKSDIMDILDQLSSFLPAIISIVIIVTYIFATALKFIGITVLALIGLLIKSVMKRKLSYKQLWILSAYAVTLPTIFFVLMKLFSITVTGQFFIYWFVAIAILTSVIYKVPMPKKTIE
ncbi:DUF1189 domain-containing protein [Alkalihalobacillus sp. AL-G]|uniref:DUF1189 domain-containing protein n=1 Tax=Alkalihalobacillus sp. AL-G TaxID=2926399 RepID=UPI00272D8605|nr:DUF1189 domain-containing protein [Alkalihalobacillus sp. AL-G]WLD92087.1 DUF1189 domain-containing protein [Alkalihalobacillus sp. AL-G]